MDEIEKFEHWFSGGNPKCPSIEKCGGIYKLMVTYNSWVAWQASARVVRSEYICEKCMLRQNIPAYDCQF
jgi:hypothetical protein